MVTAFSCVPMCKKVFLFDYLYTSYSFHPCVQPTDVNVGITG